MIYAPVQALLDMEDAGIKLVQERSEVLHGILLGLLTRNHVFLYGQPGTAKSATAKVISSALENCRVFCKQLTRQMTEEAVFGPLNIPLWRKTGKYVYNTEGGITEADVAVLEEYFDASDALIRSMNELLNEREFSRSIGAVKKCPLHTCIATSNFWRNEGDAQAVADRFLIRIQVNPLSEPRTRVRMISSYLRTRQPQLKKKVDFDTVKQLSENLHDVAVDSSIIEAYEEVTSAFKNNMGGKFYLSDRRIAWAALLMKANALLQKRDAIEISDVRAAGYGLCFIGKESEEQAFDSACDKVLTNIEKKQEARKAIEMYRGYMKETNELLCRVNVKQERLMQKHADLMTVKEGLFSRTDVGIEEIDDEYAAMKKEVMELLDLLTKRIDPSALRSLSSSMKGGAQ